MEQRLMIVIISSMMCLSLVSGLSAIFMLQRFFGKVHLEERKADLIAKEKKPTSSQAQQEKPIDKYAKLRVHVKSS